MTNIILLNIVAVILINIVKGECTGINRMFTQSYGLSLFYFPDKEYVLNLTNQIDITHSIDSFLFTFNNTQYNCSINKTSYQLNEKGINNSFSFDGSCNERNEQKIPINVNFDLTNTSNVSIRIMNTKKNEELKSYSSLNVHEHLYLMQYLLQSSFLSFAIICCGLFISFYGFSQIGRVITLLIMFALYILIEEIYEKTEYISETKELGVFVFIFTIIIGGALGVLIILKGSGIYPFFYGFSFVFSITKVFIYLIPIPYSSYSFYYFYTGISILFSFVIGIALCMLKKDYLCYVYLLTSSFIGAYITTCGLSYQVGGLIYAKVKIDYHYDNKLINDKKLLYCLVYIIGIIIGILYQFFQLSFNINKNALYEEKYNPIISLTHSSDFIVTRKSDEVNRNSFRPSKPISPSEEPDVRVSEGTSNDYGNEENRE